MLSKSILFLGALLFIAIVTDAKPPQNIYNGDYVEADDKHPYIIGLLINNKIICGGSIISPKHVLTAAHCVANLPPQAIAAAKVRSGSLFCESGGQLHSINRVFYHREYRIGDPTSPNDIAIIELKERITLNKHQNIISLPSNFLGARMTATAVGWGRTETRRNISPKLKQVTLTTMDPLSCQNYMPHPIWTHQVCAVGSQNKGVCLGDSGGPLVAGNKLVGIVSYGLPCAKGPDVYTDVFQYKDWISSVMSE